MTDMVSMLDDHPTEIQVACQSTLEALWLARDGQLGQCTCQPRDTNLVLLSSQGPRLSYVLEA